jgi:paraquat-inducible protein B
MSGTENEMLARSQVRKSRFPVIWAIPIVAIAIGVWLGWNTWSKEGPDIVVSFQDAEGLQVGQSQLKYKDITLGTVKGLDFAPDRKRVLVHIATTSQATPFLTAGTVFWVVKPRLFAGNISGFNTLLSGSYVGLLPGDATGKTEREFTGQEDPPVLDSDTPGRTFLLKTTELGSVNLGSPVFYRGLSVGEVLGWDIGDMAETVTIHAFVRKPFDSYVHDQTRFWNASGVSLKLGDGGVELKVESLRALLLGGIAFETPATGPVSETAEALHEFPLFPNQKAANAASYQRKIPLVSYFDSSVRGLAPGSDVVMHGLTVGKVTGVRLNFDIPTDSVRAVVQFEVEPQRVLGDRPPLFKSEADAVQTMVSKGLRVTLQSGNLLTGEMLVSLDVVPDAVDVKVTEQDGHFVVPTSASAGFSSLEASAGDLLRNVIAIPFGSLGKSLDVMSNNLASLTNGPQLQQSVTALAATLSDAQAVMKQLDTDIGPALRQLPAIAASLETTLKGASTFLKSTDQGYGDDTQFHRDIDRLMARSTEAVASFQALASLLTRHPEALIRGRTESGSQ